MQAITPYHETKTSKKVQVRNMFDNIAHRYDFLNNFLSLGIDKLWRKKAIRLLGKENPKAILDVATGTGAFAIEALSLHPDSVKGIDISEKMLALGREKIHKIQAENSIELLQGDSEKINFSDNMFDAVTVGFGVRNFENLEKGLSEIHRVLKQNGTLVVLEFSSPQLFPIKQIYNFYFNMILPFVGRIVSKDKRAYHYLPESVKAFPSGEDFIKKLTETGFTNTNYISLTFGIATIYIAKK